MAVLVLVLLVVVVVVLFTALYSLQAGRPGRTPGFAPTSSPPSGRAKTDIFYFCFLQTISISLQSVPVPGHHPRLPLHVRQGEHQQWHLLRIDAAAVQVVQEYERAVIFRLGRLRAGGAKVSIYSDCKLYFNL